MLYRFQQNDRLVAWGLEHRVLGAIRAIGVDEIQHGGIADFQAKDLFRRGLSPN